MIKGANGKPVNALLGAANLILQAVESARPRAVVLCLGPDAAAYRVELYPGYHAQRPEMPEGSASGPTPPPSSRLSAGRRRPRALEADDLLGAYAQLEAHAGGTALLMTGDRDMFQCATDAVTVLYVSTGKGAAEVDPAEVERRYGVDARAGAGLHRAARRPIGRPPGRQGRRREDRRRTAAKARRPWRVLLATAAT